MTPMREAFVAAVCLVDRERPDRHRHELSGHLLDLMDRARDAEEAGAAARFASAALRYLDALREGDSQEHADRRAELDVLTQVLAAVMLLRRGRIKNVVGHEQPASV